MEATALAPGPASPSARSHHSRTFSFRSDKSGGSTESPEEKRRKDLIWQARSKANPNAALSEAQPGTNAVFEESTLAPLRGTQHKDANGNVITDPDRSNPTRPRLERPLDTIRSFEQAIDSGYRRRSNYMRSDSYEKGGMQASRRNSAYGYEPNQPRTIHSSNGGYYGGNQRPDAYNRPRFAPQRGQSDSMMYSNGNRGHTAHGPQYTHETANAGASDSTGTWANSTDPSSENSSVERGPTAQRPYSENGYPTPGYGQHPPNGVTKTIPEEGGAYGPMNGGGYGAPAVQPPPPAGGRRPIPLGNSGNSSTAMGGGDVPDMKQAKEEKRKSWFSRRFSKKD